MVSIVNARIRKMKLQQLSNKCFRLRNLWKIGNIIGWIEWLLFSIAAEDFLLIKIDFYPDIERQRIEHSIENKNIKHGEHTWGKMVESRLVRTFEKIAIGEGYWSRRLLLTCEFC